MCSLVKRHACVRAKSLHMRDEDDCDLRPNEKKNVAGISTRAFPLESPSKNNCLSSWFLLSLSVHAFITFVII